MKQRNPALDVLRTFAILSVLLLHSLDFLSGYSFNLIYILSYGWIGVDLFFVLSGFLIADQAFRDNENHHRPILTFIIKRVFRTLPLYYFVLMIYLIVKPALGFPFNDNALPYFIFIQNFLSPKDFVQSWSLCIEEQFYLFFPLVFYKLKLKKFHPFIWLIPGIGSTFYRWYLYHKGISADTLPGVAYNYQFPFFTHLDGLSWGVFLASTFHRWSEFKNKTLFALLGFGGLILTLFYIKPSNLGAPVVLSFQLLAISFSAILIGTYEIRNIPFKTLFEKIALYSYGLYLWNNLVVKVLVKLLPNVNGLLKVILFIALSLIISIFTYHLVEKPFMKLRSRVLQKI